MRLFTTFYSKSTMNMEYSSDPPSAPFWVLRSWPLWVISEQFHCDTWSGYGFGRAIYFSFLSFPSILPPSLPPFLSNTMSTYHRVLSLLGDAAVIKNEHMVDKKQRFTVQHRELYPISCTNIQWNIICKTNKTKTKSLCCTPETNTVL